MEAIEEIVKHDSSITYLEAIVDFCAKNGMEIEVATKLLTPTFKQKIAKQARRMRLLRGGR